MSKTTKQSLLKLTKTELAKLSREELYQIARKVKNLDEAQEHNKLQSYMDTAHEGQFLFHKATNRVRMLLGGNRSGKTTAGVVELLWRLAGIHPFVPSPTPIKAVLLAQDFQNHVKDVLVPKLLEWAPKDLFTAIEKNQQSVPVKFRCKNGSVLDVRSHDQDIKVFEGQDLDLLWCDEPPPEHIFKALFRGLTDRGGIAFMTGTPIVQPWIYDLYEQAKLKQKDNMYWAHFMSTYENALNIGEGDKDLGQRRIKEFESLLSADEREARIEGHFLHMQGRVFKEWNRNTHLIEPFKWPSHFPVWCSIDPHPRKPWAVSWIGFCPDGTKVLLASDLVDGVVEDVANHILHMREEIEMELPKTKPRIVKTVIDNYANVSSMIKAGTSITEELNNYIYPIMPKAQSGPKNVSQKIEIFRTWLRPFEDNQKRTRASFLVFDGANDRFVYEIEHYVWAKYRGKNEYKDKPEKTNDDILDSIMQCALITGSSIVEEKPQKPVSYLRR